jgi:hypothetical protein
MSERANEFKRKFQETAKKTLTKKVQVGYGDQESKEREIGDRWIDLEGDEWEQKKGYKMKISNAPARGLADKCKDCDTLILNTWNKQIFKYNGRCYYCQIEFEAKLKSKPGKYEEWVANKEKANKEAMMKELEAIFKEIEEEKLYDKSVPNAIANFNIQESINKNKKNTGG